MANRRSGHRALAVVLIGLALLVGVLIGFAPRLIEVAAIRWLSAQGAGPVTMSLRHIDGELIHVSGVSLGPGPDWVIDDLRLHWSLGGLRAGHVEAIEAKGLRGTLRQTEDGLSFGALDALMPEGEDAPADESDGPVRIPLDRLDIENIELTLEAGANAATVRGGLAALFDADLPTELRSELRATHASEPLEARLEIDWTGNDADLAVWLAGDTPAALAVVPGFGGFEAAHIEILAHGTAPLRDVLDIERLAALIEAATLEGTGDVRLKGLPIDARAHALETSLAFEIAQQSLELEVRTLALAGPVASVGATTASARLTPGEQEQEVRIDALKVEAENVRGPGVDLASLGIEGTGRGTTEQATASLRLDARANAITAGDGGLRASRLAGEFRGSLAEQRLDLSWKDCARLTLGAGSGVPGSILAKKASLCLRSGEGGIAYTLADDWKLRASVASDAANFTLDGEGGRLAEGVLPALAVSLHTNAAGALRGDVGVSGGDVTLPGQDVALAAFDGAISLGGTTEEPIAHIELRSVQLSPLVDPPAFRPLRVTGELGREGDGWKFDARIEDPDKALDVHAQGVSSLAADNGSATIELNYLGDRAPIGRVLPIIEGTTGAFNGEVATHLELEWEDGRLVPQLRFDMLGGVDQPRDPGSKTLALTGSGNLDMTSGDAVLDLEIPDLELRPLLSLIQIEGLEMTGGLEGGVQLGAEGGGWVIRSARIDTLPEGGTIRYRPAVPPAALQGDDQSQVLIREALTDFRYEKLSITAEGKLEDRVQVKVAAWGSNPEVQGGTPIHFNLDLNLDSGGLLRASRLGQALIDSIERNAPARTLE